MELAALERLKSRRHHFFSITIDPILFKLAGNEDMRSILDEFEFQPDLTTDYGVSCPWVSEKIPWREIFSVSFRRLLPENPPGAQPVADLPCEETSDTGNPQEQHSNYYWWNRQRKNNSDTTGS